MNVSSDLVIFLGLLLLPHSTARFWGQRRKGEEERDFLFDQEREMNKGFIKIEIRHIPSLQIHPLPMVMFYTKDI